MKSAISRNRMTKFVFYHGYYSVRIQYVGLKDLEIFTDSLQQLEEVQKKLHNSNDTVCKLCSKSNNQEVLIPLTPSVHAFSWPILRMFFSKYLTLVMHMLHFETYKSNRDKHI